MYNLEEVPVSHRRRFNIVGPAKEAEAGKMMYQQTMQQYGNQILPAYHPKSRMVQRVLNRLIPHSGLEDEQWEVHVIEDPMKNAFVIPGGKVFVFSGILDVCQDDDGLAAVLGHEIAHNVAHHAAERMSKSNILLGVVMAGFLLIGVDPGIGNILTEFAFTRPGSRSQESEADYIGLLMMSESCYRPGAAMDLWARMEEEEKNAPPQFMSTHPSNHNRLEQIRQWLPEAEAKRDSSECSTMMGYGMYTKLAEGTLRLVANHFRSGRLQTDGPAGALVSYATTCNNIKTQTDLLFSGLFQYEPKGPGITARMRRDSWSYRLDGAFISAILRRRHLLVGFLSAGSCACLQYWNPHSFA